MLSVLWLKLIAALSFILVEVVVGFLVLTPCMRGRMHFMSFANCLGAGFLLGVAFLEIIPEGTLLMREVDHDAGAPISMILILVGFSLILILDKVLMGGHSHDHGTDQEEFLMEHRKNAKIDFVTDFTEEDIQETSKPKLSTSIAILLALASHSIFTGIILGVQDSDSATLSLLLGLLAHKPMEVFSMCMVMVRSKVSRPNYVLLLVFLAISTPIGIAIGALMYSAAEIPDWVEGTFATIAGGSFLYVAIVEILLPEFSHPKRSVKVLRVLAFWLGLGLMVLVNTYLGHDHDGDDPDHDH